MKGDRWSFVLLPGITLAALAITYVMGMLSNSIFPGIKASNLLLSSTFILGPLCILFWFYKKKSKKENWKWLLVVGIFFTLFGAMFNTYTSYIVKDFEADSCLDSGGCWDKIDKICRKNEPNAQELCHR